MSRWGWLYRAGAAIVFAALVGCSAAVPPPTTDSPTDGGTPEHLYVIPDGTAQRLRAGAAIEIVPADLTVRVGGTIRIVNEDSEHHVVGIFHVGAGETLTQRFASPGEYEGYCTTNQEGRFTLRVTE